MKKIKEKEVKNISCDDCYMNCESRQCYWMEYEHHSAHITMKFITIIDGKKLFQCEDCKKIEFI